jgi:branched-chain amino acid transport system ATP-binding protein
VLRLSEVHVAYGKIEAVRGVSLEVRTSEIVCLIGANGAGKTTTMLTIAGILRPSAGHIEFLGRPIHHAAASEIVRQGICLVPEGRRIFPQLTVADNIKAGAYSRRGQQGISDDEERVYALFPILKERRHQQAGTLSGGEQQMLAIGRALMGRPRLLLLDELSLGLAPRIVEMMFDTLRQIRAQGTTILLVEQNAMAALRLADRGYVMETGRISLSGRATDLLVNEDVRRAYLT